MNNAPIVIVDDDSDDRDFLKDACGELNFPNDLIFYNSGEEVLQHLRTEIHPPFLILCDVNLPLMDGFELKKRIFEDMDLKYKSIPFVFWSTQASKVQIQKSYDLGGNGFFIKDSNYEAMKQSLTEIVQYWRKSKTPSNLN